MYIVIHTLIYRLFSLSLSLYIVNMVSESFLKLSGSCGHLRRSSAALAFIQSSLSEASHRRHTHSTATLGYQLPNNRHRKTEHPIPSKTQPRTARNCITRAPTHRLKFLPHEHALHAPSVPASRPHAPDHSHSRVTRATRACCCVSSCHVSPR